MKYSALIFDFDYTLADATRGIVSSVNYALRALGLKEKETETIRRTVGMTLFETFHALTNISDEALAKQFALLFVEKAGSVMTENTLLFPDTIPTLTRLKALGVKTGIVTSKHHYRIDEALHKYSIAHLIDCIMGFEDVEHAKPSPVGLLKAIDTLSVDRINVLYVGDSLIDAKTAVHASVNFAAVTTGTTTAKDFEALPYVVVAKNLSAVMEHIELA